MIDSLDRVHRVGKPKKGERFTTQPIIARFSTFRERTKLYYKRKVIKANRGFGISVDLTSDRLSLLNKARDAIKDSECIEFVYSDINCQLRAFTKNKKHVSFNSLSDLHAIEADFS